MDEFSVHWAGGAGPVGQAGAGQIIFELNQAKAISTVPLKSQLPFASLAIGRSSC